MLMDPDPQARVVPPQPSIPARAAIVRRRLLATLVDAPESVVLISAPPGWGKSALLRQWLEADRRPSACIQVEQEDNDPVVFLKHLAEALGEVVTLDPALTRWLELPEAPLEQLVVPSLKAAFVCERPVLLGILDAQLLESDACWEVVRCLVDVEDSRVTMIIVTRNDPPLPLARLRAEARLLEVRAEELAFDRDEALELLGVLGADVSEEEADHLLERTEGWAAGLTLVGLAIRQHSTGRVVPSLRGDQREIADYLTSEVIALQEPDVVSFLECTSVASSFTADLCAALTLRDDAGDILRAVEGRNLFLVPLDQRGEWYRYHHLFAEALRARLERGNPGVLVELHRRAAVWYERQGWVGEALEHWLAAGETRQAGELVAAHWRREWLRGQIATARHWLDAFDGRQLVENPSLTVAAAWILAMSDENELQARLMSAAEQLLDSPLSFDETLRGEVLVLRARLGRNGVHAMKADAELGRHLVGSESDLTPVADYCVGVARMLCGEAARAIGSLEQAAREGVGSQPFVAVGSLGQLSLLSAGLERWDDAERYADEAARRSADHGLADYLSHQASRLAHARIHARRGDAAQAERSCLSLTDLRRLSGSPWFALQTALTMARVELDLGDYAATEAWLSETRRRLRDYPDAGILAEAAGELEKSLQQRLVSEPISPGEARVLRLLPTYLSAEGIANRIFVSKNTVRTHIASIYKKLAVDSREAAVERAFALGLISEVDTGPTTSGVVQSPSRLRRSQNDPIRIGSALPVTGFAAADGLEQLRAITLAVEQWNVGGGVHGRPFEHVYVDVGDMSPRRMVGAFNTLINEHHVDAIINGYLLYTGEEHDLVSQSGTPYLHINTSSVSEQLYRSNRDKYWMCFQCDPSERLYAVAFGRFLRYLESSGAFTPRAREVAVIAGSDPYSLTIAQTLPAALQGAGWRASCFVTVRRPAPRWDAILERVRRARPDVIFFSDIVLEDNVTFTREFLADPSRSLLYGQYSPTLREFADEVGAAAEGTLTSTVGGQLPGDKGDDFTTAFEGRFGVSPGRSVGALLYDDVNLYATAVAMAGGPEDARRVCGHIRGLWVRGTAGVYHFSRERVALSYPSDTGDPSAGMPHLFFQIQGGRQRIVYPPPFVEAPFLTPPWFSA